MDSPETKWISKPIAYAEMLEKQIEARDAIGEVIGAWCGAHTLDDIRAGFRLDTGGSHRVYGWQSDMACYSKAMANGYVPMISLPEDWILLVALVLFLPADQARPLYNGYTRFMTGNLVIKAVRKGNWKAVLRDINKNRKEGEEPPGIELYDLASDIAESRNLATAHPAIVAEMRRIMTEDRTPEPDFPMRRFDP